MQQRVVEAALRLAGAVLESLGLQFDEAKGEYYYDTENVKRSVPDADACELCEECADQEWIADTDVFESGEDEPPHHPNCKCTIEYKEKRVRVYV